MDAMQFITKEFIWIVPCLIILGVIIKQIPKIPNWSIPIILVLFGILIAGFSGNWTTEAIIQGFICGLCSTGIHQTIKQPLCNAQDKEEK